MRWPFSTKANPVGRTQSGYFDLPTAVWTDNNYVAYCEKFYARNVIAAHCIKSIARSMAEIDIFVKDARGNIVESHPVLQLLAKPNPNSTYNDFINQIIGYYYINGNSFVVRSDDASPRPPAELWTLRPDRMRAVQGEDGVVDKYIYSDGKKKITWRTDQAGGNSPVFHFYNFNPLEPVAGLSPMLAAQYSMDIHNEINRWSKATLQNSARPSGALVTKDTQTLTDEQFNRQKAEIEAMWSGSANAGRPLLLEGGLEWQAMSMTPAELDYVRNKQDVARDICLAFGYPSLLLGLQGDNTYANYSEARIALYEDTILPLLGSLLQELSDWLFPFYGQGSRGLYLCYDQDKIPALQPRKFEAMERLEKISYLTINEKREMVGWDKYPDGDDILVSATMIPLGESREADEESKAAVASLYKSAIKSGLSRKDALEICREFIANG